MKVPVRRGGPRSVPNTLPMDKITNERAKDSLLTLELYCQNSDCPTREVTLQLKDHEETFVDRVKREGMFCPVCSEQLKMHWIRTAAAQAEAEEHHARISVNTQMFIRDLKRGDPDRLVVIPASRMADDRLPPTPDGWFSSTDQPRRRRFIREGEQ